MWVKVPHNKEEARLIMQEEVWNLWMDRLGEAYGGIEDLEAQLERGVYELEVLQRLAEKADDEESGAGWRERIAARELLQRQDEAQLDHWRAEFDFCGDVMSEIEADLTAAGWGRWGEAGEDDMPF